MARYDVRRVAGSEALAVELQTDLLDRLNTRVVAPLVPQTAIRQPIAGLNPVVSVKGQKFVVMMQYIATVQASDLGDVVGSLVTQQGKLTEATEFLFKGF